MKVRPNPFLIPLLLILSPVLSSAADKRPSLVVNIPSQASPTVIPVRFMIPQAITVTPGSKTGWQLVDGPRILRAQATDASGRSLCFLMPVEESKKAVRKILRLEPASRAAAAVFQFREEEGRLLHLTEGAAPVLTYNYGMMLKPGTPEDRRRSSYIHPLYSPDGTVITDDFPEDHPHHRGLSWMWPKVEVGGQKYSLWDLRGIAQRFERWTSREAGPVYSRLAVDNGWYVGEKKAVNESVDLVVYRAGAVGRVVDLTLIFEASDRPVALQGTLDQQKGYGGFCLRFGPRTKTWITTSGGKQDKDTDRVPFQWADLSGIFRDGNRTSGAAIFVDAGNPAFPNGWTLRGYGFLGIAWPGLQIATLEPGHPLTLRYRLWVHGGDAEGGGVKAQYDAYVKPIVAKFQGSQK